MATEGARQEAARSRRPALPAADPILAAKVTAPDVPDWAVPRPRVARLVSQGARWYPLTVLTSPAGTGKTMALALWAAAESRPVAWVGLDRYDNRPGVFWPYVVAALRRTGLTIPVELPAVSRGRAADYTFLLGLASALAGLDQPVSLVLDDFHVLTEPKVLKGLDFVLRNSGAGLRLLIASRIDPLLRLHRYRLDGQLAEIRARDLAFDTAEAGLLLAQHRSRLPPAAVERLARRTEGWAAGLRLAALSLETHPDPEQFITELITEDSPLTGYLVEEVLATQRPEAREVLLATSILDRVSGEAATELTGREQAAVILHTLAENNAFVQPAGSGCYRYHTLFGEVLRLKLRHKHPDRVPGLHRRAARWYQRSGALADGVRHAVQAGDWPLAAGVVVDGLAMGELIETAGRPRLAEEFHGLPASGTWTAPQPHLVTAALALSAGQPDSAAAALAAADDSLARLPADQRAASQLAAAEIRLTLARRSGDFDAVVAAAAQAEGLIRHVPGEALARRPAIRARVLSGRAAAELWAGQLDEAAQLLEAGAAAAAACGADQDRASCLGQLALVAAARGWLGRGTELAAQATAGTAASQLAMAAQPANPAALVARAWVYLERNELPEARNVLKQAEAALSSTPDRLTSALACLAAARAALAEGHITAVAQLVARARSGWPVPGWLGQQLTLTESQACVAAGDLGAALAAAERIDGTTSAAAAVSHAQATVAAGDPDRARRALEPVLAAPSGVPDRVRVQAWLVDAQLSYGRGNRARGHRSLAAALRLAGREQLRLPFVLERGWLRPVLRRDPELAAQYQRLVTPARPAGGARVRLRLPEQSTVLVVEPLTEREREVLRHVSGMLNTAEVASEMYISINTVKTHLKSIYRKLAATHRGEAVRRARQLELI
jgi:LuxR family transcriptional regulator, maltose regulon positive regulatory protein